MLDLRTKTSQFFGSVADIAFNKKGDLLAYTVDATIKDGNGLFVYDTRRGRVMPLDNDAKIYNRLADRTPTPAVPLAEFRDWYATFVLGAVVEKL